jgi:hypothetical protein
MDLNLSVKDQETDLGMEDSVSARDGLLYYEMAL